MPMIRPHSIVIPTGASRSGAERRDPLNAAARLLAPSSNLRTLIFAMLTLGTSACRDAPAPPTEPERTEAPQAFPLQLTYSVQDDRAPTWSADGDTVYYVAHTGLRDNRPVTELRAIPRAAGIARELMPQLRGAGDTVWLADPSVSRDGDRIAFARVEVYFSPLIMPEGTQWICQGDMVARADSQFAPRLGLVRIHVRDLSSSAPLTDPSAAYISLDGRNSVDGLGTIVRYHPFQRLWETESRLPFHPSWAPDGLRVAFSDGLSVLVWNPTSGAQPASVPGTGDGVDPAWSPDGTKLAFTRLVRGDSAQARCIIPTFPPFPFQERTVWNLLDRRLVISSIDGSTSLDLGIGEDPAWSPDGRFIYARRNDAIWRIAADGSSAVEVPGTSGGREPAVSPTGDHLALARLTAKGDYDIWVVGLE